MDRKKLKTIILLFIACIIAYLFILPFMFMIFTSFKELPDALGSSSLLPKKWTLENYKELFTNTSSSPVGKWVLNTTIVTVCGTILRVMVSTLAAYALARLNVPYKRAFIVAIIWALAIPEIVTYFPSFYIFKEVGLLNSFAPLILPSGAGVMMVYLVYNFMLAFPKELEESAYIDGATLMQTLRKVILPSVRPIILTQGFITFLALYNDYFWPSLVINRTQSQTITLGIAALVLGENYINPGLMMAATVVAVLPVTLIFIFINKYIVKGFTQSGIK